LVQDTDVFVSALLSGAGASRELLRRLLTGRHCPLMGDKLWYEHLDLIGRAELWRDSQTTRREREQAVEDLAAVAEYVPVLRAWRPNLPDADDDHVMELAIAGRAEALVTFNVRDFAGALFAPPDLSILRPGEFLNQDQ
jgi:predicted nucleic acid-binding protein